MKGKFINKPVLTFIITSTVVILVSALVGMVLVPEALKTERIEIETIDISKVPDGTYYGSFESVLTSARVLVTVEDQRIADIDLIDHEHSNGAPAERVLDRVLDEQCLGVDTVSGATTSSKVLLKAVENALNYGLEECEERKTEGET